MKTSLRLLAFSAALATSLLLVTPSLLAGDNLSSSIPNPAAAPLVPPGPTAGSTATVIVVVFMDVLFALTLLIAIRNLAKDDKWSLASALSECVITAPPSSAQPLVSGNPAPLPNPTSASGFSIPPPPAGSVVAGTSSSSISGTFYESSTSRLIAFIGMLATVFLFFGFGNWVLWQCLRGGRAPADLAQLIWFLGGGASLFVPYALNQLRGAMESSPTAPRRN